MSGLFSTFNIARRGMNAQQAALQVTSHNVANANTEGYSVQRADLKTTQPFGMPSLNSAAGPGQLGTGVEVSSITRSRDEFLDTSIRKETSTFNKYTAREEFLSAIESIFTEPSDTGIASTMTKFWESWNALSTNPESSTARTLVADSSNALAHAIKHSYTQLEDLEVNIGGLIQQQTFETSSIMKQIANLNEEIKSVTIGGKIPNDLMDRRDVLLEKLSERVSIEIEKTDFNGVRVKTKLEDKDKNVTSHYLITDSRVVNGIGSIEDISFEIGSTEIKKSDYPKTIISLPSTIELSVQVDGDINKPEKVTIQIRNLDDMKKYFNVEEIKEQDKNPDGTPKFDSDGNPVYLTKGYTIKNIQPQTFLYDKESYGVNGKISNPISANFQNGSLNGLESLSHEINDYKEQLNNLARSIAISVNTIHSNSSDPDNGVNFFYKVAETSEKAAKELKVNEDIVKDATKINAGKYLNGDSENGAGNGERAMMIASLRNVRMDILNIKDRNGFIKNVFRKPDGSAFSDVELNNIRVTSSGTNFTVNPSDINLLDEVDAKIVSNTSGTSTDNYFKSTISKLGVSNQEARRMVKNQESLLDQLVIRRESISGVSIDEEMTNMIQFQRTYQANAKMINVIDELLNVVVNGLIR
jgi:flagellar hook-associated protein 1